MCASLPLDGVSDRDYEAHVMKYHIMKPVKEPEEWSVFMAAQNLPAVLNDPSRGKQSNIFTKKWGDSFVERTHIAPSPFLPEITFDHLDGYIKQIGKRYRRHIRLNQNLQLREQIQTGATKTTTLSSSSSISSLNDINQSNSITNNQNSSSHRYFFNEMNDARLEDIPTIFTKPNLDFNNLETFEAVFPGVGENDSQKSGRLLQEKLSHYLDIVEVQIAKQVSSYNRQECFKNDNTYGVLFLNLGIRKIISFLSRNDLAGYDNGRNVRSH